MQRKLQGPAHSINFFAPIILCSHQFERIVDSLITKKVESYTSSHPTVVPQLFPPFSPSVSSVTVSCWTAFYKLLMGIVQTEGLSLYDYQLMHEYLYVNGRELILLVTVLMTQS